MPEIRRSMSAFVAAFIFIAFSARASHMAGAELSYVDLGKTSGNHKYRITLTIYEDCANGIPETIAQDNPAFFGIYRADGSNQLVKTDSAHYTAATPTPSLSASSCGMTVTGGCVLKKTFIFECTLPASTTGYYVTYERCCGNAATANINSPGTVGLASYCTLPPAAVTNNSAVFKKQALWNTDINKAMIIDFSASDADGDSLTYELTTAIVGANENDVKPWPPAPPPFSDASYLAPFSATSPIASSTPVALNNSTGILTATPSQAGTYVVAVLCHEWRAGVLINTVRKQSQVVVAAQSDDAYHPEAGQDITISVGASYHFNASGATTYSWSPATYLDNPNVADPVGTFTQPGHFTYTVHGITDSGCTGDDRIDVTVLSHSAYFVPAAFTPNGDGVNDLLIPLALGNCTLQDFSIFNRLGNRVFHCENIADARWDGTWKGRELDLDVFCWQIKYLDESGKSQLAKGNVTIIR